MANQKSKKGAKKTESKEGKGYDSLVIGQMKDEKSKVQSGIEKERKDKEAIEKKKASKKPIAKKKKAEVNWFMKFLYFIQALFFGSQKTAHSPKFLKKREMKQVIENFSPLFYEANIQKIRPSFPEYMYRLYRELEQLNSLFSDVFISEEEIDYNQPIFFLEYVDQLLIEGDRILLDSIDEHYFEKLISNDNDPENALNEKLKVFQEQIENYNQPAIIHYTSYFEKFLICSQFSFFNFFQLFDIQFADEVKYKPRFHALFGETGKSELINLDSHLQQIDFGSIPENLIMHFDFVIESIRSKIIPVPEEEGDSDKKGSDDEKTESLKKKEQRRQLIARLDYSSKHLNLLLNQVFLLNKKKIIEALVRLMSGDFEYETPIASKKEGFLYKRYLKMTIAKKKFLFHQSFERIKEAVIQAEVLKFFSISNLSELQTIENYTLEVDKSLQNRGLNGYSYIGASSIFKTFYNKMYNLGVRKIVNSLLIEGDFVNKREQRFFSEAYYNFDKITENFKIFDEEFKKGETEVGEILRYASGDLSEGKYSIIIQRKLSDLEIRLESMLIEGIKLYKVLLTHMNMAIDDHANNKSNFIANIKSISGGSGNRQFIIGLNKSIDTLKKFLDLIIRFPRMDKANNQE